MVTDPAKTITTTSQRTALLRLRMMSSELHTRHVHPPKPR